MCRFGRREGTHALRDATAPETFRELRDLFREAGDRAREEKLNRWVRARAAGEATIAFAGHFSAGKSTLINRLLGAEWLPGHPRPTSANVVRIRFGEPGASAVMADMSVRRVSGDDPAALRATLDTWCRDGQAVREVGLTVPASILDGGLCFLDTPGADSTDERHAQDTGDVLFLADLTVYVTDYNHVESSFNFSFIEGLQQAGKPYAVVVNQIDKHNEWELPFEEFAGGVRAALAERSLAPLALYFVSALDADVPESQWERLAAELPNLARQAAQTVVPTLRMLAREHDRWLNECENRKLADTAMDPAAASAWQAEHERARQALAELEAARSGQVKSFRAELLDPIRSAILAPYETTERAVSYILSLRADFRVGLIGTRAKTESERRARLQDLAADLARRAAAHIEAHIVRAAQGAAREHGVMTELAKHDFAPLRGLVDEALVSGTVARGAQLDRDYGYHYAKELERAVRERYAEAAEAVVRAFDRGLQELDAKKQEELRAQLRELEVSRPSVEEALAREKRRAAHMARMDAVIAAAAGAPDAAMGVAEVAATAHTAGRVQHV